MRINQNIKIIGNKVVLVPYKKKHVAKYHKWMQSHLLQNLTASDPLSLKQEYEMQNSWIEDPDKLTFMVLTNNADNEELFNMIGDVNLFFTNEFGDKQFTAEIDIMIAEKSARGKGYGTEAVKLMMQFAMDDLKVNRFICKIGEKNTPSLNMFWALNFSEVSHSEAFREVTLEWIRIDCPDENVIGYRRVPYDTSVKLR